jgi:hypothetical protein
MIRSIDHIVIAVRDLAQASADYRCAGFTVTPGGEHTGGATHNALISFADGAYFELIAFTDPDRPQEHRWWSLLAKGEGLVDYALLADDLTAEEGRLRPTGVGVDGTRDGGRVRPDGQRVAWRTLVLRNGSTTPLPFLIQDLTPRALRVPEGAATIHPLGVDRVAGLVLLVGDLATSTPAYTALLATEGIDHTPEIDGVRAAKRFSLGSQWIELAEPDPAAVELQNRLQERGPGPYQIVLAGKRDAGPAARLLPVETTHGARIVVEPSSGGSGGDAGHARSREG